MVDVWEEACGSVCGGAREEACWLSGCDTATIILLFNLLFCFLV